MCFTQNHSIFLCSCWLSLENGAIWAFVAPALFVILVGKPMASVSYWMDVSHLAELSWRSDVSLCARLVKLTE